MCGFGSCYREGWGGLLTCHVFVWRRLSQRITSFFIDHYHQEEDGFPNYFVTSTQNYRGSGSSVCVATYYGLDDPGPNTGGDETFRPSRQALGPTQPSVK